jgi:hypothetical protein
MALQPLNLPARQTKNPGQEARAAQPGEPAHDLALVAAYIDNVVVPAIDAAATTTPTPTPEPIEVSG